MILVTRVTCFAGNTLVKHLTVDKSIGLGATAKYLARIHQMARGPYRRAIYCPHRRLRGSLQLGIAKTRQPLNWNPSISVDESLHRTTERFRQ